MIVINIKVMRPLAPEILQLLSKYLTLNVILKNGTSLTKLAAFFLLIVN